MFLLVSRCTKKKDVAPRFSFAWHFTKHCSTRHKRNPGTRIRFSLLSAIDEQVAGRRDFNKPEVHCASARTSHIDKGCREKEDGCRRERCNEEVGWSEHGESLSWGLHCCRATLIMTSIPTFIYDEFVTQVVRIPPKFCILSALTLEHHLFPFSTIYF